MILVAIGIQILVPIQACVYLCKQETVIAPTDMLLNALALDFGVARAIAAALTGSLATQAIIFFFIWAEKSLRRARQQRRAGGAEEPDDVESGDRSPQ